MGLFSKEKNNQQTRILPQHVGIIMDGNGRWAKKRGLPRTAGHTVGANNFRTITKYCSNIGIPYLTVYAFSTENWKRPADEVQALMKLFRQYLEEALRDFQEENIKVIFLGDKSGFAPELQELIERTEEASAHKTGMVLNIAMNYGGRDEIAKAARELAQEVKEGKLSVGEIDEQAISNHLYTAGQPDPDLIIRPSGERRISNFLLWQSAYAEYVTMDVLWPDFKPKDLERALDEYAMRNRRFGGV
ncbi:MAG: isoprenyl transferase [Clostridium sp.]